ncbi:MAG: hypothetical protein GXO39_09390 [Thermotogae bacterium]|nr:hypothetical protein [Thermotogota bacterium]
MIVLLVTSDPSLFAKAYLPHPPKEYVPLKVEELKEFARVNRFERSFGRHGSGPNPPPLNLSTPNDTLLRTFMGIDYTGWIPPDPQMAVGSSHVVVVVNTLISFFNKWGGPPVYYNTLRGFFASVIPSGGMAFDPKVAYDIPSGRWLVLALYYNSSSQSSYYLLAVSEGDNPTGGWYFYRLNAQYDDNTYRNTWADYPEIGFNDRWIVLASQQIGFSSSYYYPKLRVINKDSAYNGTLNGWTEDFVDSDLSCIYNWPRPSRSTYTYSQDVYVVAFNKFYRIYGPTSSPQLSPCVTLPIASYSYPPDAPQGGGYQDLETVGATFQVLYLDGKLYYTFSEEHPLSSYLASSRLVVLDTSGAVLEDVALYENGVSWIYPAVSVSPKGVVVVFTRVGTSDGDFPSAAYVSRSSSDVVFSSPRIFRAGSSWYFNDHGFGRNRWGDYFGGGPDPNDSTLWVIGEVPQIGNDSLWTTWVAQIGFKTAVSVEEYPIQLSDQVAIYTVDGRRVRTISRPGVYLLVDGDKTRRVVIVK